MSTREWGQGYDEGYKKGWDDAMTEKPEQEPVAWMEKDVLPLTHIIKAVVRREKDETYTEPLYTTPPSNSLNSIKSSNMLDAQRKPLTDEEIDALAIDKDGLPNSHLEFARAIEAKIKEKNT